MKTAVAIITMCRWKYLDKCLSSLENCIGAEKFDWHFFQDNLEGYPESKTPYFLSTSEDIEKNIARIKSTTLPVTNLTINSKNEGVNNQINKVFNLFNEYERLFIFEDDLVVCRNYLRLLDRCSEQYPNVTASFHTVRIKEPRIPQDLHKLEKASRPRLWGFYLTRDSWNSMKSGWKTRYDPDRRTPYYDTIVTQLIRKHTEGKYQPLVARAYNIGMNGLLTTNPSAWKSRKLDKQTYNIEYEQDDKLENFKLLGRGKKRKK